MPRERRRGLRRPFRGGPPDDAARAAVDRSRWLGCRNAARGARAAMVEARRAEEAAARTAAAHPPGGARRRRNHDGWPPLLRRAREALKAFGVRDGHGLRLFTLYGGVKVA